jgi:hypothetical protein
VNAECPSGESLFARYAARTVAFGTNHVRRHDVENDAARDAGDCCAN